MRNLFVLLMFLFISQYAFAEQGNRMKLKINFNYQHHNEINKINNTIQLDTKNQRWEVIGSVNRNSNRLILLAQLENSDSKVAKIRFLLLENSNIISQPEMILGYNEQSKMILEGKEGKISLNAIFIS